MNGCGGAIMTLCGLQDVEGWGVCGGDGWRGCVIVLFDDLRWFRDANYGRNAPPAEVFSNYWACRITYVLMSRSLTARDQKKKRARNTRTRLYFAIMVARIEVYDDLLNVAKLFHSFTHKRVPARIQCASHRKCYAQSRFFSEHFCNYASKEYVDV